MKDEKGPGFQDPDVEMTQILKATYALFWIGGLVVAGLTALVTWLMGVWS